MFQLMVAPDNIKKLIIDTFSDKDNSAYGQVATVSGDLPQVRTVHIHYIKEYDALAFNGHINSSKWRELQENPKLSGCYFDMMQMIQFRWDARATLIDSSHKEYTALLDKMWLSMREEVRSAYWLEHKNIPFSEAEEHKFNLEERTPNLGTILCKPTLWNVYELNPEFYPKGKVTIYKLEDQNWVSKEVSILGCLS
jgi:pyridoxine/pyridoxamine 5'-phosphate oxidase